MTNGATPGTSFNPVTALSRAVKLIPQLRYAVGVIGVAAAVSIVLGFIADPKIAVFGIIITVALMYVIAIFAQTVGIIPGLAYLAAFLAWAVAIMFVAVLALLISAYAWGVPKTLADRLFPDAPKNGGHPNNGGPHPGEQPGGDSPTSLKSYAFNSPVIDANGSIVETIRGKANYFSEDLGNQVKLEMVEIPGGTFNMGTKEEDIERYNLIGELQRYYPDDCVPGELIPCKQEVAKWPTREMPQHPVTVRPFFIGKYEVTQEQWREVARWPMVNIPLEEDPSVHKGKDLPVERISWRSAVEFCERLSKVLSERTKSNRRYRLPTEAEWEYAYRAGTQTQFPFGENVQPGIANYRGWGQFGSAPRGLDRQTTVPVGSLGYANRFGLFDMAGNVWEWCLDRWHDDYNGAPRDGSAWLDGGLREYRVVRGGSWWWIAYGCRSAHRNYREESETNDNDIKGRPRGNHGLRVVLEK